MINIPSYTVLPASGELGRNGAMRISGYQHLICSAAESDMVARHVSTEETLVKGYAWAIVSITVDVLRPLCGCRPLTALTWLSSDRHPINRRELQFFDGEEECFRAAVFSTPVSVVSHAIIRPDESFDNCCKGEPLLTGVSTKITGTPEMHEVYRRNVFPSDIDALGHMNNCRYGALAYDALTEEERSSLSRPFRFTINFRRQLFEGSTVCVSRGVNENGVYVVGASSDDCRPSFIFLFEFS